MLWISYLFFTNFSSITNLFHSKLYVTYYKLALYAATCITLHIAWKPVLSSSGIKGSPMIGLKPFPPRPDIRKQIPQC